MYEKRLNINKSNILLLKVILDETIDEVYLKHFNISPDKVIHSIENPDSKKITDVGENPSDIAYNPDNKFIYITNLGNDRLYLSNKPQI